MTQTDTRKKGLLSGGLTMTYPVKGPVTVKIGGNYPGSLYSERTSSVQRRPFDLVLPYTYQQGYALHRLPFGLTGSNPSSYWTKTLPPDFPLASVNNRAKEKLYGKLGVQVDIAVNLAERRQSIQMIANRCTQLLQAFRQVRKGQFKKAARTLGLSKPPSRVSAAKSVSNNWLEYHFGWSPLLSDIHGAVEVLQGPPPKRRIRAGAFSQPHVKTQNGWPATPPYGYTASKETWIYSVRSGFTFQITNPDLWLANRLGLINPATVAWEVVPFSFVVDWFIPIGDFLSSMTATVGLKVTDGWKTFRVFHTAESTALYQGMVGTDVKRYQGSTSGWGVSVWREGGALSATPTLTLTPGFSPVRAFTALTLLVQQMKAR